MLGYLARHNAWSTRILLDACKALPTEKLAAPAAATFGSIGETFTHLVVSDGHYLASLGGPSSPWVGTMREELKKYENPWSNPEARERLASIEMLAQRADEIAGLWETFLASETFDPERRVVLDQGTYECPAGVVMAQAFHHGSIHREQICSMLSGLGIEPPDIQPWAFADETGLSTLLGGRTEF